ncbi:MAG: Oligopeptidase, partial [Bryobacterales bacterium]|nr:Oligopeptidase [Bryobacterales bacterium]
MRRLLILSIAMLVLAHFAMSETPVTPPTAKRVEHREERHGATVIDNYFWLREKSNPEVIQYLESENAYTEALSKDIKPFEDALYKEMLGRIKQTDLSVPVRRGEYFYYSRTEEGKQYPIQCRKKGNMDSPEEILLDLNELAKGLKFLSLGAFSVSNDQQLLAYTADTTGFRQYKLHVKDLRTGATLPDTAERVTSLAWAADNKTIFYTTEDAVTKRSDQLWRTALGAAKPDLVYEEKDELFRIGCGRTKDKQYILLEIAATDSREYRYLAADHPQSAFKTLLPREKDHKYDVEHRNGLFYIRTNKNAKNFRVVTAPVADPRPANWKEFIPHQPNVLMEGLDMFSGYAVAFEKS